MTSPAVPSPAAPTESSLPFEAPEFSILEARGTLKIPLTSNRAIHAAPIDAVLCSFVDWAPTACPGAALARQFASEIVAGALLVARIVGAPQCMICADQRLPASWLSGIRKLTRKTPARLITMVNDYPQADPTLLLYTLQHRRLRPGRLPVELGVIVLDAAASFSIGRRFLADEPTTHLALAIRDHARKLSHFVMAPI